jgi:L-iditol 2-dehydrogenase
VNKQVRAAVIAQPHKVETRRFPYPKLEDGAMLIKMEMSGICGSDKHCYKGEDLLYAGSLRESRIRYPVIPGHENVGIVADITPTARREREYYHQELKEGDRVVHSVQYACGHCYECRNGWGFVWCDNYWNYGLLKSCAEPPHLWGGWSEYVYIPPHGIEVYKVPEGMPPEVACLAEPFTCTVSLDKAKDFAAQPSEGFCAGDTVVVLGTGPLGLLLVAKSRILGAGTIIAVDRSPMRLQMAREFSADHLINVDETTSEERIQIVKDLTHGRGADLVIDGAGIPEALVEGLEMLGNGGVFIEEAAYVDIGSV